MKKITKSTTWVDYTVNHTKLINLQKELRLPIPLLQRIKEGLPTKLSETTLDKLRNHYNTYWTKRINKAGIPLDQASEFSRMYDPYKIIKIENNIQVVADKIHAYKHKAWIDNGKQGKEPLKRHILKGLRKSKRTVDDFIEMIISYGKKKYR